MRAAVEAVQFIRHSGVPPNELAYDAIALVAVTGDAELLEAVFFDEFGQTELDQWHDHLSRFFALVRGEYVEDIPPRRNEVPHFQETIDAVQKRSVDFSEYRETEDVKVQNLGGDYDTSPSDVFVTGEDSILEKICQTYQISTFEADEILSAHRSFEGSTINLKGTYSIHFIEQTEEFLSAQDRNKGKTGFFGSISKMTTRLATEPRNMWRKYQGTRALHRSLVKIIDTYELPKATNERPESIITAIYNIRNEANDISNAQASMEGRRIFDTLRRKEHMLERLDI